MANRFEHLAALTLINEQAGNSSRLRSPREAQRNQTLSRVSGNVLKRASAEQIASTVLKTFASIEQICYFQNDIEPNQGLPPPPFCKKVCSKSNASIFDRKEHSRAQLGLCLPLGRFMGRTWGDGSKLTSHQKD